MDFAENGSQGETRGVADALLLSTTTAAWWNLNRLPSTTCWLIRIYWTYPA